ncbi:transcriptional repressor LexA [Chloroflexota bacterium]
MVLASMKDLSSRQQNIINFIHRFFEGNGYPPSVRDIKTGCKISSTSVVDYNLRILAQKGHLRRHPEVSRGIEITAPVSRALIQVPIVGKIAAGKPIPALTAETWDVTAGADTLTVSRDLVGDRDGIYALRVKGMSMVDALINDGDMVLMQSTSTVTNGEMAAVWLKAEKEVTLKKVYVESDKVRLQPANSSMQPIYVKPDNVEIQGRVISVIRQLV